MQAWKHSFGEEKGPHQGILSVVGEDRRVMIQAVQELYEAEPVDPWPLHSPRSCKFVFIVISGGGTRSSALPSLKPAWMSSGLTVRTALLLVTLCMSLGISRRFVKEERILPTGQVCPGATSNEGCDMW
ncbi:hypothetical protein E2C01_039096 [Portunus trituberculatus]|uniref:CobW C-terminal domain-containing protein n=1 Tax=Portunus trituberculatus TaxID=210409 RepID=A0A5B7FK91_PORTR|nr:hypothetical protein [Portunus trituberculatus]